jgi:hypothetical protein
MRADLSKIGLEQPCNWYAQEEICTEEIEDDGNTNKARKGKRYRIHKKEITGWDIKMKTAQLLAWVPKVLQSLGAQ